MQRPEVLQIGLYPPWDQEPLDATFSMHRLFEAGDKQEFLKHHGPRIRAIATRGELGASRDLIAACPQSRDHHPSMGSAMMRSILAAARGTRHSGDQYARCADQGRGRSGCGHDAVPAAGHDWCRALGARWQLGGEGALSVATPGIRAKRAGILGLGRIGYEVARGCRASTWRSPIPAGHPKPDAAGLDLHCRSRGSWPRSPTSCSSRSPHRRPRGTS